MEVRRTHSSPGHAVLDALARTTTEDELFATPCAAALEREEIESAWVEPGGRRGELNGTGPTAAIPLLGDDGPYATLHLRAGRAGALTDEALEWAQGLAAAADVIARVRQTVANRFRRALAGSEVALFMMNRDLRYTWIEYPSLRDPSTVLGLTDAELLHEPAEEVTALKRRVIEHGEHVAQEIAVGDRTFWMAARPLRDADGEITGLAGQAVNVTARKYAERELDRIASAAEHGMDAVISLDREGRVQRWSHSAERLFGYTAQEARGRTLGDLGPAPDGHAEEMIARVLTEHRPVTFDAIRHHRDGTPVDVRITLVPWEVDDEVVGVTGMAVDISDRARAERERRRAIEDLEEAQRLAGVGSWSLETDTGELLWSSQMWEIYGFEPGTPPRTARELLPYVHPEDRAGIAA